MTETTTTTTTTTTAITTAITAAMVAGFTFDSEEMGDVHFTKGDLKLKISLGGVSLEDLNTGDGWDVSLEDASTLF